MARSVQITKDSSDEGNVDIHAPPQEGVRVAHTGRPPMLRGGIDDRQVSATIDERDKPVLTIDEIVPVTSRDTAGHEDARLRHEMFTPCPSPTVEVMDPVAGAVRGTFRWMVCETRVD